MKKVKSKEEKSLLKEKKYQERIRKELLVIEGMRKAHQAMAKVELLYKKK